MIRQNLMPKEMLRDWKVQPIGGIFGDSAEGKKRSPKMFLKKCGQTLQAESSMVRTLFEGRRQTYVDGRPCCVGSDCHQVLHLYRLLVSYEREIFSPLD